MASTLPGTLGIDFGTSNSAVAWAHGRHDARLVSLEGAQDFNCVPNALRQAMAGRTTFVVANRLSLLRRADVILVLAKGRLTQMGTHGELLRAPGPYQETARLQLSDWERTEQPAEQGRGVAG